MNYYISDTHFRHANIIKYDKRPWDNIASMEKDMITRWNGKVQNDDDTYIIGDFCFGDEDAWIEILSQLNGRKHLILGNHDPKEYSSTLLSRFEEEPQEVMYIQDGDYTVVLCHYPMISYWHDNRDDVVMLHGHVHNKDEAFAVEMATEYMKKTLHMMASEYEYKGNIYNVWCGAYNWTPVTLNEILEVSE